MKSLTPCVTFQWSTHAYAVQKALLLRISTALATNAVDWISSAAETISPGITYRRPFFGWRRRRLGKDRKTVGYSGYCAETWMRMLRIQSALTACVQWRPRFNFCRSGKYYNTLCLSTQILNNHCLFSLGNIVSPKRNRTHCLFKIWVDKQRVLWYFRFGQFSHAQHSLPFLNLTFPFLFNLHYVQSTSDFKSTSKKRWNISMCREHPD